jgi:DNA-binding transcriptional regulator YiaG
MKQKYKSDVFRAMHEAAVARFKVGAMSKEDMNEWDEMCFVAEVPPVPYSAHKAVADLRDPISTRLAVR